MRSFSGALPGAAHLLLLVALTEGVHERNEASVYALLSFTKAAACDSLLGLHRVLSLQQLREA